MKAFKIGDKVKINKMCKETDVLYEVKVDYKAFKKWQEGTLTQDAFPYLNAEEREFLISGKTPAEWDKMFESEK